jgi:hypothetical protein
MSSNPVPALPDTTPSSPLENDALAARRALAAVPDRAAREAAALLARQAYCARLKEARERRGISLETIADLTKVNEGLFVGLERNDVSRWPTGLYRRAFFRAYAHAVGLPVESSVIEFLQLFPDGYEQRVAPALPTAPGPLRMTLAGATGLRISRLQILAALIDCTVVAAIAGAIAWWMPVGFGITTAIVAMIYYSLATACLASSPASRWLRMKGSRKRARSLRLAR